MVTGHITLDVRDLPTVAYIDRFRMIVVIIALIAVTIIMSFIFSMKYMNAIISTKNVFMMSIILISLFSMLLLCVYAVIKFINISRPAYRFSGSFLESVYFKKFPYEDLENVYFDFRSAFGLDVSVIIFEKKDKSKKMLPVYILNSSFRGRVYELIGPDYRK